MRKIKLAVLALLCAVTVGVTFGAVKSVAKADDETTYTYVDTSAVGLSVNSALTIYPRITLTNTDYNLSGGTYNGNKVYQYISGLTTFSKIKIDGVAMENVYDGSVTDPHLNMYDNSVDRFAFKYAGFDSATEVVIEAGCEFPSYALWSGTGNTVYRTTETVKFEKHGDVWVKYENTSAVGLSVNTTLTTYPRITLTNTDYSLSGGTYNGNKDYQYISGLTTFSKIKIDGVAMENVYDGSVTDPHLNMYDNSVDRFAFKYAGFDSATEVVIEAGCEFPSYALWSGKGSTVYRTAETVRFEKRGNVWIKYENTSVVSLSVNSALTTYPRIELTNTDYSLSNGTYSGNTAKDYQYISGLTTFSKIKIDGVAMENVYGASETDPHLNMYDNSVDRFAFKYAGFDTATEVVIEAGCEFPSYALWSGKGSTVYRTTETYKFKKVNDGWYKVFVATFVDEGGNTLGTSEFTVADEDLVYPSFDKEEGYDYVWTGNELKEENITVTLTKTIKTFDVKIGDGEAQKYNYGAKLAKPENPEIIGEAGYEITFKGWFNGEKEWNFETDTVTENVTLTAKFDKKAIEYKAILTFADGAKEEVVYTVENRSAKLEELNVLKKENNAQYSYSYNLPEELPLGDCEYAETRTVNKYAVTIGESTLSVEYGSKLTKPETDPVKEEDENYTYAFKGWFNGDTEWDFENDIVTGDLTLTAEFIATEKEHESGSNESSSEKDSNASGSASLGESGTSGGCFGSAASGISALSALAVVCAAIILIKKKEN